jgi:hypothetical protein
VLRRVFGEFVSDSLQPVCLCRSCLERLARLYREASDTATVEKDFYLDDLSAGTSESPPSSIS